MFGFFTVVPVPFRAVMFVFYCSACTIPSSHVCFFTVVPVPFRAVMFVFLL
jgi:hypothetical protein